MVTLKRVEEAKVIKRNLPIQNYTIVDGFSLGDEKTPCENCNKLLTNVMVVKGQNGREYNVGTDCAATLSGINQNDIDYWNDAFKQSKSIRAKLNKWNKKVGSTDNYFIVVYKPWGGTTIEVRWRDNKDEWSSLEVGNDISSLKDFIKYCPDLAKRTYINPKMKPYVTDRDYDKAPENSGEKFEGYTVEYKNKNGSSYATLYKNGKELGSYSKFSGMSPSEKDIIKACQKACIEAYLYYGCRDESEWKVLSDIM